MQVCSSTVTGFAVGFARSIAFICERLAGPAERAEFDPKEVLEFTLAMRAVSVPTRNSSLLWCAVDDVDVDAFRCLRARRRSRNGTGTSCATGCAACAVDWSAVSCVQISPTITKVGLIPADAHQPRGLRRGPERAGGSDATDAFSPGPYGHHPFGGLTFIEGSIFTVANVDSYKVESAPAPAGPWTPMLEPVWDFDLGTLTDYQRSPTLAGWFAVADIGLFKTSLSNWVTPSPDGLYYLKVTARNTAAVEFESGLVPVLVDNTGPSDFTLEIKQRGEKLPCCAQVAKDGGPLEITVTGQDANFEALSISLRGGCNVSYPVFSKTYNGNVLDTGAPPPGITFPYDPWAAGVEPCCYVLEVTVSDRAIVANTLWAHHVVTTVHSITIA